MFVAISVSTFSSRCRFGSCLPTFFIANCSGVIFSSSSKAYKPIRLLRFFFFKYSCCTYTIRMIYVKLFNWHTMFHLVVILCEFKHLGNDILIEPTMLRIFGKSETVHPCFLMQVQQHLLLQLVLAIINTDTVIMPIQSMYQRLNRRFL